MEITLTILKEDILQDNYLDSENCPITKALHRAGYTNSEDSGAIYLNDRAMNAIIDSYNNESYRGLLTKLFGMYRYMKPDDVAIRHSDGNGGQVIPTPIEPADFTHVIKFEYERASNGLVELTD